MMMMVISCIFLKEITHDSSQEEDWEGPEGTRLWGWTMQPVKEATDFPELGGKVGFFWTIFWGQQNIDTDD